MPGEVYTSLAVACRTSRGHATGRLRVAVAFRYTTLLVYHGLSSHGSIAVLATSQTPSTTFFLRMSDRSPG